MSNLTFNLRGAIGLNTSDSFGVVAGQALTPAFVDPLRTAYEKISDLSVLGWVGSEDITLAAATTAEAGCSREVTWGLKVRKTDMGTFTHDMMQPLAAMITNGEVDTSKAQIKAFADAFLLAAKVNLSNGESMLTNGIIKAYWKRRTKKHSHTRLP